MNLAQTKHVLFCYINLLVVLSIALGETLASDVLVWGNHALQFTEPDTGYSFSVFGMFPEKMSNSAFQHKTVVKIEAGTCATSSELRALVLTSDGTVFQWGYSLGGTPSAIPNSAFNNKMLTDITAGAYHSMALASDGTVFAWGYNSRGQFGYGSQYLSQATPSDVSSFSASQVVAIDAGAEFSMALTTNGDVYTWGSNSVGQLGTTCGGACVGGQSLVPVKADVSNIIKIAAGLEHALAITDTGRVFAWGSNSRSELGKGNWDNADTAVPSQISMTYFSNNPVTLIAASQSFSMAVTSTGEVYAWGMNQYNNLAIDIGTTGIMGIDIPTLIPSLSSANISMISAGPYHVVAASSTTVYTWGDINDPGLGRDGAPEVCFVPTNVTSPFLESKTVTMVAAGISYTIALIAEPPCPSGYTGTGCSTPICFNTRADNSTVCGGRGNCTSPDTCSCSSSYAGSQCQYPICEGVASNVTGVCNGRGTCASPNSCTNCQSGWTGSNCHIPICYGVAGNLNSVCNGRGQCIAPNTCSCSQSNQDTDYGIIQATLDSHCAPTSFVHRMTKNLQALRVVLNDSSIYYVNQTIQIESGSQLVIPAGITLIMAPGSSIIVQGTLVAQGNSTHLVVFTNSSSEGWSSIQLVNHSTTSILEHVKFINAGVGSKGVIETSSQASIVNNIQLENCTDSWAVYACEILWQPGIVQVDSTFRHSKFVTSNRC